MQAAALAAFVLSARAIAGTEAIRVDQAGYQTDASKVAFVGAVGENASFTLNEAATGKVVFTGQLAAAAKDSASGDTVRAADFSAFHGSGRFYVAVPAVGKSWTFAIAPDVYKPVYFISMRGYYGQRCGTAVDLAPDFPAYKHAICHQDGAYDKSSGKEGPHSSAKGWHDAGDYGRYVVNGGISTGTLLWAWELFHDNIKGISLHIPESGNGTPDILSEIRWNVDWMMSMQDTDGGVYSKQTSSHFSAFIAPAQDKLPSLLIGTGETPFKSSCASGDLAAVAAITSRAFRPYDAAYADKTLRSAEMAWQWLDKNPNSLFVNNPPGISTGAYSDGHCEDERLWAAAELARTTQKQVYRDYFVQHYGDFVEKITPSAPPSWGDVGDMALWSWVLGGNTDKAADEIRTKSIEAARQIAQRTEANPYRISLTEHDFIWGSNAVAMNYSMQLLVANQMQPDPAFVAAAMDNLHYILGRNTFSLSWITHVGEHPFQHPHHRPSGADGSPWPGLMSGGPNAGRQDAVMKKMVSVDTPPARSYVDETGAYACNEIAINWNAPLVFVLAAVAQ